MDLTCNNSDPNFSEKAEKALSPYFSDMKKINKSDIPVFIGFSK